STRYPDTHAVAFALLVAPDGRVMASSYPQRYPTDTPITTMLSNRTRLIAGALEGGSATAAGQTPAGRVTCAVATVWSREGRPTGAIYVQVPEVEPTAYLWPLAGVVLLSSLVLLLITAPLGGLFGALTTRGLVRRLRDLATATALFASGD